MRVKRKPEIERLLQRISVTKEGCWDYMGARYPWGYGSLRVWRAGKWDNAYAHRVSFEFFKGPIPEGLHIDHLCYRPSCFNPDHLEAVAPIENGVHRRRSDVHRAGIMRYYATHSGYNALKTHCPKGHPYDEENTLITKSGRACRACRTARNRARFQKMGI